MNYRLPFIAKIVPLLAFVIIVSCTEQPTTAPMCRSNASEGAEIQAPAGCIIRIKDSLIIVKHKSSGKFDIPKGIPHELEGSQCSAHRHTWEMTGFNVLVKDFHMESKDGTRLYECELNAGFTGEINQFPVPQGARHQLNGIYLKDPFSLTIHQWSDETDLQNVRKVFNQTSPSEAFPSEATTE